MLLLNGWVDLVWLLSVLMSPSTPSTSWSTSWSTSCATPCSAVSSMRSHAGADASATGSAAASAAPAAVTGMAATATHPHVPKALLVHGAAGKITVTYFTVPHNPEQVATLQAGRAWHLGFAALDTEVTLRSGQVQVPAGKYKLNVLRGEENDSEWRVELVPAELMALSRPSRRNESDEQKAEREQKLAELKVQMTQRNQPERILLPLQTFAAANAEHLALEAVLQGYTTQRRNSIEPAGGVQLTLRMSFGDLHRSLALDEVYAAEAEAAAEGATPEGRGEGAAGRERRGGRGR